MKVSTYHIGIQGKPWTQEHKDTWRASQNIKRNYQEEVLERLATDLPNMKMVQYGALPYDEKRYPLKAFVPTIWQSDKPNILVTGGVHGYETSGVQGAIDFLQDHASDYLTDFNIVVVPCISPWGYETINRWNPLAIDPNRSFYKNSPAPESAQLMAFVDSLNVEFLAHFDLHETTDTDDSEFRPALAARDGLTFSDWGIPDGFYTVANTPNPQLDFQAAIISSVEKVTHIAPPDEQGNIIGSKLVQHGVICYDKKALFLCAGVTNAHFVTTTEVYPDSAKTDAENCRRAQVAALTGGLNYLHSNARS